MGLNIDAHEVRALGASLNRAAGTVGAGAAALLRKSTSSIERTAKATVHARSYESGDLYDSIGSTVTGDGRFGSMSGEVVAASDHAGYVEEGTSEMAAEPYLGPAFDAEVPKFESGVAALGGKIL